jgi:hypothetical protein
VGGVGLGDSAGVVLAATVGDDQFDRVVEQGNEGLGEGLGFVEGGNDDGNRHGEDGQDIVPRCLTKIPPN